MSALILFLAIVGVTPPLSWLAVRRLRRERKAWALYTLNRRVQPMTAAFEATAQAIGDAFIPAIKQMTAAFEKLGAALVVAFGGEER